MGWEYSEKTKQLFMNAVHGKPGTHLGEIENPDGMGEHGSIVCGDSMRFTFRVKRHPSDPTQDIITEAKYLTFGCTSAIASSEALCEIIEAGKLYAHNGADNPEQRYCRIPAGIAGAEDPLLRDGRRGARSRRIQLGAAPGRGSEKTGRGYSRPGNRRRKNRLQMLFNHANRISNARSGNSTCGLFRKLPTPSRRAGAALPAIMSPAGFRTFWIRCGADSRQPVPAWLHCRSCLRKSREITEFSPFQFAKKVEKVLDEFIRPSLRMDGGDVEIMDIKGTHCLLQSERRMLRMCGRKPDSENDGRANFKGSGG